MKPNTRLLIALILAVIAAGGVVTAGALFFAGERPKMIGSGKVAIGGPFTLTAATARRFPIRAIGEMEGHLFRLYLLS